MFTHQEFTHQESHPSEFKTTNKVAGHLELLIKIIEEVSPYLKTAQEHLSVISVLENAKSPSALDQSQNNLGTLVKKIDPIKDKCLVGEIREISK